jgi:GT2 family glycosyltransferase
MTPTVLAVIPGLAESRAENIIDLTVRLDRIGVDSVVVTNGRRLRDVLRREKVRIADPGRNLGFGAAIAFGAAQASDWEWLLLVNDDVELEETRFRAALDALSMHEAKSIVYFDDAPPIPVPTTGGVFLNLSTLAGVAKRLRRRRPYDRSAIQSGRAYLSFSVVAISRELWDALDGFDPVFPFTFEDADFVRHASEIGAGFEHVAGSGVRHLHSATTRSYIDRVLPVSAWGAYSYLRKWETSPRWARIICMSALIIRIPAVLVIRAPKRAHLRGIVASIAAVRGTSAPALPGYDDV